MAEVQIQADPNDALEVIAAESVDDTLDKTVLVKFDDGTQREEVALALRRAADAVSNKPITAA